MVRSKSRSLARLLLAGAALTFAVGTAAAQSTPPNQQGGSQPSGGLVLPGTVQTAPGGSAAGTINPQQQPQPAPQQARPAPQQQAPAAAPGARQGQPAQAPAGQRAPQQPAGAPPAAAAAAQVGTPTGDWTVEPDVFSDGAFKMCVTGNQFDNGLELLFLKNPENKVNMVLGVPGARMQPGARTMVKVRVDRQIERERPAAVSQPDAMVIALDNDPELFRAIGTGNVLSIQVQENTVQFRLRGTAKAMTDLTDCVSKAMAGTLQLPPPPPAMPPQLAQLLVTAGLKDARALPVDRIPPEQRPGDFAWQIGDAVLGSIRSIPVPTSAGDITKVPETYVERLKASCQGTATHKFAAPETLTNFAIRTGEVICKMEKETVFLSVLFQMVPGPEIPDEQGKPQRVSILNIFTHEAQEANRKVAEDATSNIAGAMREMDKQAAAQRPPQQ